MNKGILVWDLPTRVFHWALAVCFIIAYVTGDSDHYARLHVTAGYSVLALILFRIDRGFFGSRYALFSQFWPNTSRLKGYLDTLFKRQPKIAIGHNPLGALAIFAILLLGLGAAFSGWLLLGETTGEWLEEVHETAANLMLGIVIIHVAGVLLTRFAHDRQLITAMFNGRKQGREEDAIKTQHPVTAFLLLVSLLGFWGWSFTDNGKILMTGGFAENTSDTGVEPIAPDSRAEPDQ